LTKSPTLVYDQKSDTSLTKDSSERCRVFNFQAPFPRWVADDNNNNNNFFYSAHLVNYNWYFDSPDIYSFKEKEDQIFVKVTGS
jgi:hypothetical protein